MARYTVSGTVGEYSIIDNMVSGLVTGSWTDDYSKALRRTLALNFLDERDLTAEHWYEGVLREKVMNLTIDEAREELTTAWIRGCDPLSAREVFEEIDRLFLAAALDRPARGDVLLARDLFQSEKPVIVEEIMEDKTVSQKADVVDAVMETFDSFNEAMKDAKGRKLSWTELKAMSAADLIRLCAPNGIRFTYSKDKVLS